jgi:hypothetical protein
VAACKLKWSREILYVPPDWEWERSLSRHHVFLPDPHAGVLEDPQLAATYREVCASLEVDPAGRFIRRRFRASMGWGDSEDEPSIGPFLAQFSSRELAILRAAWGGLLEEEAFTAYAGLTKCLHEDQLYSLREHFGPLRSADDFDVVHRMITGDPLE